MCTDPLQRQVIEATRRFISLARTRYRIDIAPPQLRFDLRGRAAGMVVFYRGDPPTAAIRYNDRLLQENKQTFIQQTVPHEVAHLISRSLFGTSIKPHGPEWRTVMTLFEADPSRCHNFSTEHIRTRRMKRFLYRCDCREHWLSTIRHHRNLRGTTYLCRACGLQLVPINTNPIASAGTVFSSSKTK